MIDVNQYNFQNKKALVRVDFNVPLNADFQITDDARMQAALPTIKKILLDGGSVILMSHLGRPKEGPEGKFSLKHLISHLKTLTNVPVHFADDCISNQAKEMGAALKKGEILLLENLRFYKEETKGDEAFAQKLANLGDVYVNDAFGTAHRAHASTAVIAKFFPQEKVCGLLMKAEIDNAMMVLENSKKPFTAIMGGAKISDKLLIIENLLDRVDNLLIGGAMSFTFFKAMGGNIGNSLVELDKLDLVLQLMDKAKQKNVNLMLPLDCVIASAFSNEVDTKISMNDNIPEGWMGLDIGPAARESYAEIIKQSKTILWNGPMGVFEMSNFSKGTNYVAQAIVEATQAGAFSLIGGGDSAAAIHSLGLTSSVSYVSTGGGALLEYFEGKKLPGVVALEG